MPECGPRPPRRMRPCSSGTVYLSAPAGKRVAVERYIAAASLGLFAMFSGEIITVYNFMQEEPTQRGAFMLEPDPKILQFISIGAAPALVMAGVSYMMTRRYGSRPVGAMIAAGGAVMMAGMAAAHSMIGGIDPAYESEFVPVVTPLFMASSAPVMAVGALLMRTRPRRPKKEYV